MFFISARENSSSSRSSSRSGSRSNSKSWSRSVSWSWSGSGSWSRSGSGSGSRSWSGSMTSTGESVIYSECQSFEQLASANFHIQIKEIENNQNCSEVGNLVKLPRTIGFPWASFCLEKRIKPVKIHEKETACLVLGGFRVKLDDKRKVNLTKVMIRDKIWMVWR